MGGSTIQEKFLRHIWSRQYLRADLRTSDGKSIVVLSPGNLNEDGGPDFRNARIRIGETLWLGDVEVHRNVAEWLHHGHQTDPAYNRVILHVVLEGSPLQFPTIVQCGRTIPVLVLREFLSESIHNLEVKAYRDEERRKRKAIACAEQNRDIDADLLEHWIRRLSVERLELKIRRFEERLRELVHEYHREVRDSKAEYGDTRSEGYPEEIPVPDPAPREFVRRVLWDQILYEGIMDGLGYSKNRSPFVRLARTVSLNVIKSHDTLNDPMKTEALLLGVAGLLPLLSAMRDKPSRDRLRILQRHWKKLRRSLKIERLHRAEWQLFPTRPVNFPTIRMAAVVGLVSGILRNDLFRRIIQAMKSREPVDTIEETLRNVLKIEPDEFWKTHYRFGVPAATRLNPLGSSRIKDIVANTLIPISFLYARIFRDLEVRENAKRLYEHFSPLDRNSILVLMEDQLLRGKLALTSMATQQGVLQLYRYYCREQRCKECDIGKTVFKL